MMEEVIVKFDDEEMSFSTWLLIMHSVSTDDGKRLARLADKYASLNIENEFQAFVDAYGRGEDIY